MRALLFVPGLYIILLISAILSVFISVSIVAAIYFVANAFNVIPTGMIFAIMLGVFIGIFAIMKGIILTIWRAPDFEPALLINKEEEIVAISFIDNICNLMVTQKPDYIIIHSEPVFYVKQGNINVFNGKTKGRILAIGLPFLGCLSLNEFRSILVHEFAHFTGNDTKYSAFVLPVYVGIITAVREMNSAIISSRKSFNNYLAAIPLYLPCQLLKIYLNRFSVLDMRISRSREQRADAIACIMCGTNSFASALRKVASIGPLFQDLSKAHIIKELENGRAYVNYYKTFRNALLQNEDVVVDYEKKMLSETDESNRTHPTLRHRLEEMPVVADKYQDEMVTISIFNKTSQYEEILTEKYTQAIKTENDYEIAINEFKINRQKEIQGEINNYRMRNIKDSLNDPDVIMICPNCGAAYSKEDIAECADCGAQLISKQEYLKNKPEV